MVQPPNCEGCRSKRGRFELRLADRAYVLENGRVKLSGTGAELARTPEVRHAYLGG
jgi:branched-chain amino acid transport system ATP-binding protein